MIETEENRQQILQAGNEKIVFDFGELYCIPGSIFNSIAGYDSVYDVTQQEYLFTLSTEDCVRNEIIEDISFEYTTSSGLEIYTFSILFRVDDLTGFTLLKCKRIDIESNV